MYMVRDKKCHVFLEPCVSRALCLLLNTVMTLRPTGASAFLDGLRSCPRHHLTARAIFPERHVFV